ncbi:MAG: helix-turn-helix domain-containing protein [Oscillospiraceae bacterium]|jgi:carbohydrate diacid regulator|nr:helix-turn-helix domain-containing protein [Oscillospiraceae bacterium]
MNKLLERLVEQCGFSTDRILGIVDGNGHTIAANTPSAPNRFANTSDTLANAYEEFLRLDGYTFRSVDYFSDDEDLGYSVFVEGEDEIAKTVAGLTAILVGESIRHATDSIDKSLFLKNLISDNTLLSETYAKAVELRLPLEERRAVFLVRQESEYKESYVADLLSGMFPDRNKDFAFSINDSDCVLIKSFDPEPSEEFDTEGDEYESIAQSILNALRDELMVTAIIGIGSTAKTLRDLPERYKEAQVAIEIGKVFSDEKTITRYDNLGIGRIIYQLPRTLCERFLAEIFKKSSIEDLESEVLHTINHFFDNNLNVSETSRKLFVHRNTLVYRLEKIKRITGLDIREFDHAIIFKVALMIRRYLASRG